VSLRTRIVVFNAVVVALAFLATAVALAGFWAAYLPLQQAVADEAKSVDLAQRLRAELAREALTASLALAGGATDTAYRSSNAEFDRLLAAAAAVAADAPARAALEQARAAEARFNARAEQALVQRGDAATSLRLLTESLLPARDEADTALDRFLDREELTARAAERGAARQAMTAGAVFVATLAVAGIAGAGLSLHLSRNLLARLSALGAATALVARGDRTVRVLAPSGGDELDRLGADFNQMVEQLSLAEAAARRVDELKASFLASVSHDLRTPLTTVKGLLETLRRDDVEWDPTARREFLDVAASECDRLVRLVANVLDLSRLEAGAWPLDREAVALPPLARAVVEDLSIPGGALERHRVTVEASGPREAWADELQIRRVLENLLTNAAKFSPPGSLIRISIRDRRGRWDGDRAELGHEVVEVRVRDQGPGIRPEDTAMVFEKFYRGPAGAGAATSGTGLGLAICRGILEAHGGRIWAESAGAGAAFAFVLPAAAAQPSAVGLETAAAPAGEALPVVASSVSPA
jgi:signal transduction histidine kinase